jgi:hypothetical protein
VLVSRDGGGARTIAKGWSSIDGLAWAPHGRSLWISASRDGGNNSVRELALDGHELAMVPSAGRLRAHDVAADGRLAVTQVSGRLRMMAKARGAAGETDLSLSDVSLVADMSADGASLVFAEYGDVDTANGGYIRPTTGGSALRLGAGLPLDLADDGRGVLAIPYSNTVGVAIYPVAGGQPRTLELPMLAGVRWARWCNGDRIVLGGAVENRPPRVWRHDPRGLLPLTDEGVIGIGAVSPDGRTLALVAGERLLAIDIDTSGAPRVVSGTFADECVCGWHANGADVFVRTKSSPIRVRRVNVTSGEASLIVEIIPPALGRRGVYALAINATGDAYAYSYGQELSRLYAMTTGS